MSNQTYTHTKKKSESNLSIKSSSVRTNNTNSPVKHNNKKPPKKPLLIKDLGWSREEAIETRMRLINFEEDWNAPGMEGYDDL